MTIFPNPFSKVNPLRVFVVEDHPVSAEYLRRHLECLGHSVVCAETMREALEKLPQAECDVLLCDIALPDGNGCDLLPLVDADLPRPTYAVAMSAHVVTASHLASEKAGFHDHLDKPIDPAALEAVLEEAAEVLASFSRGELTAPKKLH